MAYTAPSSAFPDLSDEPPATAGKRVFVRHLPPNSPSARSGGSAAHGRQVLLAHKIRPGQTIHLKGTTSKATMADTGKPDLLTEALVSTHGAHAPSYDTFGKLQPFSVLGPVGDFERRQKAQGRGEAMRGVTAPARVAAVRIAAEPDSGRLSACAPLDRITAREDSQRAKSRDSLERAAADEERQQHFTREWDRQLSTLSSKVGRPTSSLNMSTTSSFRERVLSRQREAAVSRKLHPYNGELAWQVGLRGGGLYYEVIGNASNGLYCPYRPPGLDRSGNVMTAPPPLTENQVRLAAVREPARPEHIPAPTRDCPAGCRAHSPHAPPPECTSVRLTGSPLSLAAHETPQRRFSARRDWRRPYPARPRQSRRNAARLGRGRFLRRHRRGRRVRHVVGPHLRP